MQILAFDTSTEYCSVALLQGDRLTVREELAGQTHSERLLPMVQELLNEACLALDSLDAIAFGEGPGSFTGLRIACGVAQGLALGSNLPLIPVTTLEALAQAALQIPAQTNVLACLDARMGELYVAAYSLQSDGNWQETLPPQLCAPDALPALPGKGWFGSGTGFAVLADRIRQHYGQQLSGFDSAYPKAAAIAILAAHKGMGAAVDAAQVYPLYIRNKVARKMGEAA